jgi:Fe-S cluster assembly protein SufD
VHVFSPDSARTLTLPFAEHRVAAAERAAAMPWPTAAEEIWRYSRIGDLDLAAFELGTADTTVTGPSEAVVVDVAGGEYPDVIGEAPDVFAELNVAFSTPTVVRVPRGVEIAEPIIVTHRASVAKTAIFPRLVIDVGENADVTVVERFESTDDVLVAPVVQVRAGRAARVRYLSINDLSERAWQIGHQQAVGEADSTIMLSTVALGGHYARTRTEARVAGRGASTKQLALYFAGGTQMHDFRTIQDHDAPNTTSDLLFKGAVQDESLSVYTGLIRIRPHARGTTAFQTNRNLTLGEKAWAESVPNLDIQTNDVRCSHASTVGPIDPEHRFYLESRGVPTSVADRLIVLGFFDEVISQLPVPAIADELRTRVAAKLDLDRNAP